MDEAEASSILLELVSRIRCLTYSELVKRYLGETEAFEVEGSSKASYEVEVEAFWDNPRAPGGNLRVMASIDDGRGWRAYAPLTHAFIISPDGVFIGE